MRLLRRYHRKSTRHDDCSTKSTLAHSCRARYLLSPTSEQNRTTQSKSGLTSLAQRQKKDDPRAPHEATRNKPELFRAVSCEFVDRLALVAKAHQFRFSAKLRRRRGRRTRSFRLSPFALDVIRNNGLAMKIL